MERKEIEEKVKNFLVEELEIDEDKIWPPSTGYIEEMPARHGTKSTCSASILSRSIPSS